MAILIVTTAALLVIGFSTPWTPVCLTALAAAFFLMPASQGPVFALVQDLTPTQRRATATAFLQLISNGIGLGLGPLVTGVLSDALRPRFGDASLSYALLCLVIASGACSATAMLLASRRIEEGLRTQRAADALVAAEAPALG
jgi:MFS family permease